MADRRDLHKTLLGVNEIDDAVGTAACRPCWGQWGSEGLTDTLGVDQKWTGNEFKDRGGDLLRQRVGERARHGPGHLQLVSLGHCLAARCAHRRSELPGVQRITCGQFGLP